MLNPKPAYCNQKQFDPSRQYIVVYKDDSTQERILLASRVQGDPATAVIGVYTLPFLQKEFAMPPDNYFLQLHKGVIEQCTVILRAGEKYEHRITSMKSRNGDAKRLEEHVHRDWQRPSLRELFDVDPFASMNMWLFRELWDRSVLKYAKSE